ncbi:MAG TPA: TIGR02757 family protein [Vicinamibacterales bacterium]|nr:TIGR02757 family protein [Vicinamibacterales bacterium]
MRASSFLDLKSKLDALYDAYNAEHSVSDPIWIVRRFRRPEDQEIVGFCAAALAFGRVQSVLNSIEGLLAVMGSRPAAFVRAFDPDRDRSALDHLVHRWTRGIDLAALVWILKQMIEASGSVEQFFAERLTSADETVESALEAFSERACRLDVKAVYGTRVSKPGVSYFFARPSGGGACKRLNLFLRWMVRRDAVDLGIWTRITPSQLVVPLDTHVIRVGRCLSLTRYSSPGWRMAMDITRNLRTLDPTDPVKYDFSLCHIGMMNACGYSRAVGDRNCPLRGRCHPKGSAARKPLAPPRRNRV